MLQHKRGLHSTVMLCSVMILSTCSTAQISHTSGLALHGLLVKPQFHFSYGAQIWCWGQAAMGLQKNVSSVAGTLKILHSENGREFVNVIIHQVVHDWPNDCFRNCRTWQNYTFQQGYMYDWQALSCCGYILQPSHTGEQALSNPCKGSNSTCAYQTIPLDLCQMSFWHCKGIW